MSETIQVDERRFLDERGTNASLAPNGLNPARIMEKAVCNRIVDSYFYQEQCFALNEADVVDRVVEFVHCIGGTYGVNQKPTPFLCLAFKLLQLAPSDAILREYVALGGEHFKYLRALALFYIRLTRTPKDVYEWLEPHLEDPRKLKRKGRDGTVLTYMDEFVDSLLTKDRVCGTSLFKMPKREVLEDLDILEPRSTSDIEDLLEAEEEKEALKPNDDSDDDDELGENNDRQSDIVRSEDDDRRRRRSHSRSSPSSDNGSYRRRSRSSSRDSSDKR